MGTTIQKDSIFKNVIKNLCCSYGWSYGAIWSFDQSNSLILTLQDAYFEEEFGSLIDNLLLQVPLGGGMIGQAAYTNKHMWMSSEDHYSEHNFSGSIWDVLLYDYEFRRQFSCGMKTIAVIPVESLGVVQFGSSEKIMENMEFLNQTKRMFLDIVNGGGSEIGSGSLHNQICHQNGPFDSFISSGRSSFTGGDFNLMGPNSSNPFDELQDFSIPDEFFQTGDFNFDGTPEALTFSDIDLLGNNGELRDILAPIINGSHSVSHSSTSECMPKPKSKSKSTQHVDCTTPGPKERLFSKLGIEELLEGVSGISHDSDQVSAKRRKTGNYMREEGMAKPESGLTMVNGYGVSGSSTVLQAKKQVEPLKLVKKKAKPGTRPRPKDRQQILDRMAELRQLIPNGEKMSIDCLLDRTIKHMIFLQNVTKQAYKLKQADEQNNVVSNVPSTNGATWACELGNQTMVCPLMVKDLVDPGQMLIEMLCEEQGFFLEIMDIIRRFGLIILKGVMESRGDKIWARFIVEPEVNKHLTRHEIFSLLIQFLQTNSPTVDNMCTETGNSLMDEFHEYGIQNLTNMADLEYCINL